MTAWPKERPRAERRRPTCRPLEQAEGADHGAAEGLTHPQRRGVLVREGRHEGPVHDGRGAVHRPSEERQQQERQGARRAEDGAGAGPLRRGGAGNGEAVPWRFPLDVVRLAGQMGSANGQSIVLISLLDGV